MRLDSYGRSKNITIQMSLKSADGSEHMCNLLGASMWIWTAFVQEACNLVREVQEVNHD